MNKYFIHLIDLENMETVELSRVAASREKLVREINSLVKCYEAHGYNIDKVKVFDSEKHLVLSYS